jgi:hypothetical protein
MAFEGKHTQLLIAFAEKFGLPNQGDEHARAWTLKLAQQFRSAFPTEGWGTKRASLSRPPSTDVIARKIGSTMVGYDTVRDAGVASAVLIPSPDEVDMSDQVFIAVDAIDHLGAGSGAAHTTALFVSCFGLLGMFLRYRDALDHELDYAFNVIGVDGVRAFANLRPNEQARGDVFEFVGMDYRDPAFRSTLVECSKWLQGEYGGQIAWCLNGNRFIEEHGLGDPLVDAVIDPLVQAQLLPTVKYFEMWNEWVVNGAARHTLRNMARRARSKLPTGFPIALSSPNTIMGGHASADDVIAEINGMYGGDSGANLITLHPTRPDPIWDAHSIYQLLHGAAMQVNPALSALLLATGEPRGPGASAGGDVSQPRILAGDYISSIDGGAIVHVYHPISGIFHGRTPFDHVNHPGRYEDEPNAAVIAEALSSVRKTGSGSGAGGGTQPPSGRDKMIAGESIVHGESLVSPGGHANLHCQHDGNLVVYLDGQPIWASGTAQDALQWFGKVLPDGAPRVILHMQPDGNLVLTQDGAPVWATNTSGHAGAMVQLQDDGNFVIYEDPRGPLAGTPIYATGIPVAQAETLRRLRASHSFDVDQQKPAWPNSYLP